MASHSQILVSGPRVLGLDLEQRSARQRTYREPEISALVHLSMAHTHTHHSISFPVSFPNFAFIFLRRWTLPHAWDSHGERATSSSSSHRVAGRAYTIRLASRGALASPALTRVGKQAAESDIWQALRSVQILLFPRSLAMLTE